MRLQPLMHEVMYKAFFRSHPLFLILSFSFAVGTGDEAAVMRLTRDLTYPRSCYCVLHHAAVRRPKGLNTELSVTYCL
jgi:hypothetical protein